MEPNEYGIALSNFTLGFIYHNFAEQLCDCRVQHLSQFCAYLQGDSYASCAKAADYYEEAAECFKQVNHKMGEYLSRRRQLEAMKLSIYPRGMN